MHFTDVFIRRPVLAVVVSLFIFLIGLSAALQLQVRQYPKMESATISISTIYPGATQEVMQGFVTTPITQAIATASGIEYITSSSSQGRSSISAKLVLNADADRSMTEVLSKVQQIKYLLPPGATDPVITKITDGASAIQYISFISDTLERSQLVDFATRVAQPLITAVPGVASADVSGGAPPAMRIWVDPMKLAARNLTATEVAQALRGNNVQAAPGQLEGTSTAINITAGTDLRDIQSFRDIVIRQRGNSLVRLSDVAVVELGAQNYSAAGSASGRPSATIAVTPTPDGNPLNLLTLLAMVLAIGLVVDDAIVVVENIHRHIEEGLSPLEAALVGAREIVNPVIAMTITLAAVYAPIGMMGGLTGALFKEFAFALASAVIVSGVVALTLSPMMSGYLLHDRLNEGRLSQKIEQTMHRLTKGYSALLDRVLSYRAAVLATGVVIMLAIVLLFQGAERELAPQEDMGYVYVQTRAPQYANIDYTRHFNAQIDALFHAFPEYDHSWFSSGGDGANAGFGGIVLSEAAAVRMRPVLMTTAAMVAGLIPLLFASGAGAASRFAIGIVVVMGLLVGTVFTLFVLPTFYTLLAGDHRPAPAATATQPASRSA